MSRGAKEGEAKARGDFDADTSGRTREAQLNPCIRDLATSTPRIYKPSRHTQSRSGQNP
jgi:hypothetical protein